MLDSLKQVWHWQYLFFTLYSLQKTRRLENVLALTNDEYDMENVSFIPFQLDAIVMDIITKEEVNVRTLLPT